MEAQCQKRYSLRTVGQRTLALASSQDDSRRGNDTVLYTHTAAISAAPARARRIVRSACNTAAATNKQPSSLMRARGLESRSEHAVHLHTYTYIHTYIHIHTHAVGRVYIYICIYIHTYIHDRFLRHAIPDAAEDANCNCQCSYSNAEYSRPLLYDDQSTPHTALYSTLATPVPKNCTPLHRCGTRRSQPLLHAPPTTVVYKTTVSDAVTHCNRKSLN